MKIFYVYQLRRADSAEPFYVGKGKGNRAQSHLSGCENNLHKNNTIKKANSEGVEVLVEILKDNLDEQEALRLEVWYIKMWGRRDLNEGPLTNYTDGGDGPSGAIRTAEWKSRQSSVMSGSNNPFFGKTHDQETRSLIGGLMRENHKNNPEKYQWEESRRESMSSRMTGSNNPAHGKPCSEASKAASVETIKGTRYYANPETLEVIRADYQPSGFYPWHCRFGFQDKDIEKECPVEKIKASRVGAKRGSLRVLRFSQAQ